MPFQRDDGIVRRVGTRGQRSQQAAVVPLADERRVGGERSVSSSSSIRANPTETSA
jgi:hypothetical protein